MCSELQGLRPDVGGGLVHLTRPRMVHDRQVSAFENLKQIISDGVLRAGTSFIKGGHRAVCLTEIPLSALRFLVEDDRNSSRYSYYGISISKQSASRAGARPVIYLPDDEIYWIPDEQRWRVVRFEFGSVDFTHEREWRCPGDINLADFGIYIMVRTSQEADEIRSLVQKSQPRLGVHGVLPMNDLRQML